MNNNPLSKEGKKFINLICRISEEEKEEFDTLQNELFDKNGVAIIPEYDDDSALNLHVEKTQRFLSLAKKRSCLLRAHQN